MGRKLIKGVNDFASQKPWAAKYWSDKNELKPDEVSANSKKEFLFDAVTESGVEYSFEKSPINIKTIDKFPAHKLRLGSQPFIKGHNDFNSLYPEYSQHLDNPSDIQFSSNTSVNYTCVKGHTTQKTMGSIIRGNGCGVCDGKLKEEYEFSAYDAYPELKDKWLDTNERSLKELKPHSNRKIYIWCDGMGGHVRETKFLNYGYGKGCGVCAGQVVLTGAQNSLEYELPNLALEYHESNQTPASKIHYGSSEIVTWKHSCGYMWKASISNRSRGTGCPRCNVGWKSSDVILLLKSLPLNSLSTSDKLSILNLANISICNGKRKGIPISSWVRGKISNEEFLEALSKDADTDSDEPIEETLASEDIELSDASDLLEDDVRKLRVNDVLDTISSFDKAGIGTTMNSDEDMAEYFVHRFVGQLWNSVWNDEDVDEALKNWEEGGTFQETIRTRFVSEFEAVTQLETPKAWPYPFEPSMMQKYVAVRMGTEKRVGNWSGTGAGKTASAVLANLHIGNPETIVLCPNAVVSNWEENTKTLSGWHIFNFEKLSTDRGLVEIDALIKSGKIGMVVVDELHYAKFRGGDESKRRQAIERLMGDLPDAYVLGMTATPVINNLQEAVSVLEIVEGRKLDHMGTTNSMNNIVDLHQRFIRYGVRYVPDYKKDMNLEVIQDIIKTDGEFRGLGNDILAHEQKAVELKMDSIIKAVKDGGVIYCHFVEGIVEPIGKALTVAGLTYGVYTGTDKSGLAKYLSGEVDVLIGSSSIGTGIDGLQHKKSVMVLASMPWTDAEYRQIIGRIYRQGNSGNVKIYIPQTDVWCTQRLQLIETKRTLSKAVMDGELPQVDVTDEQVTEAMQKIVLRLQGGEQVPSYTVEPLDTDLIELVSGEYRTTQRNLTDFQSLNRKWNTTNSTTLHDELSNDASEWYQYHEEYSKSRETWEVVPFKVFSEWLTQRKGKTVADLGCGEALLNGHGNKVLSFDHVAVNDKVAVADISDLSEHLEDNSVDIAILSLALMGSNWNSYLDEALRITGLDSQIWIAETKTHVENWELEKELESRGLTVNKTDQGKFVFFRVMV